jgi:DNA polymerase-3 subunit delta
MIIKHSEADRFASRPPAGLFAALVFGPDSGLVRERAERLARSVVSDLNDAFLVSELDETILLADPARLADEAASISMLGGRRVVRVRDAGNGLTPLFARFLAKPSGDALIVVEAGDLSKAAALRKLFEDAPNAAALGCYGDTARDLAQLVREVMKEHGLAITADGVEEAVVRLGSDRGVSRRELEKLALYARDAGKVAVTDVRAVMGDEAEARTEEVCDAAGEGNLQLLDLALSRLWAHDTSPVAVVRIALSHFQRLAQIRVLVDRGEAVEGALKKLRPPLHFSRQGSFRAQIGRWNAPRLQRALELLLEAEELCKTTAVPSKAACGRALLNIASLARMR